MVRRQPQEAGGGSNGGADDQPQHGWRLTAGDVRVVAQPAVFDSLQERAEQCASTRGCCSGRQVASSG